MFKYITSFFWNSSSESEISLADAYDILETPDEINKDDIENSIGEVIGNYDTCMKKGLITDISNECCTIDNTYHTSTVANISLKVGSSVSYKLFLSNGEIKVGDIHILENDWDTVSESKSSWCDRTIICKVSERKGRHIIVNPGEISIDLNNVSSEFIPIIGDWIQLDVRCEIDENVTDLGGKILEIHKLSPLRPQIKLCSVSQWDSTESSGVLQNNIYFTRDSLSGGYTPVKGDKVVAEIIESNQGRCSWRALKLVPEFLKANLSNVLDYVGSDTSPAEDIDGILIHIPPPLVFKGLKEVQQFTFVVENVSMQDILLNEVHFPNDNTQCLVLTGIHNSVIEAGGSMNIFCECMCKSMGESREYIVFSFYTGKTCRWIDIRVQSNTYQHNPNNRFKTNNYHSNSRPNSDIIRGQRVVVPPRFIAGKCLDYPVNGKLFQTVTKYDRNLLGNAHLKEDLSNMKPSLFANLSFTNYLDKFHTLLHLEEIHALMEMSNYDQEKACFIQNGEYFMLEIENLSERRPSIIVGDRIFARDPYGVSNTEWEGFVHKIGAKHVYIKFSHVLHDTYKGEDYSLNVVSTRTAVRRLHQAVDLAVKNLGIIILFPTQVITKPAQINFTYDDFDNTASNNEELTPVKNEVEKSTSRKDMLKKMQEYKNKSPLEKKAYKNNVIQKSLHKTEIIKLEWYDTSLNYYQKEAVRNILLGYAKPLPYVIFGPPGTGKTVTVVEAILQILRLIPSSRLLVATPSNSAADLLANRLINSGVLKPGDLVRLVSNTYVSSNLITAKLAPFCATGDISKEGTHTKSSTVTESGLILGSNSAALGRHRITVTTCSSAGLLYTMGFPRGHFTHIFVDEAGQAMEPEVMIPLAFLDVSSGQAILAGDPMQLGPVVMSQMSNECGLQESFLERLTNRFPYVRDGQGFPDSGGFDPRLVTKLLYNYRSLPELLQMTSSLFYNNDLIPTVLFESSEHGIILKKLQEILPVNKETKRIPNIVMHGINGENYQTADSPSWFNPSEAGQVFYYINELYRLGLKMEDIGIISPYIKQVKEIRSLLTEAEFDIPKIGTVEEFQGQEFNVIILSTVRSNQNHVMSDIKHSLGFVSSPRRLNVALSRAKALLIIIGNPNLLYGDKHWQTIINHCIQNKSFIGCEVRR